MTDPARRTAILARLRELVPGKLDLDASMLVPEASLADLGVDSFSMIELVFLIEEAFQIKIPLEDLHAETVSDVLDVIDERLPAKPG